MQSDPTNELILFLRNEKNPPSSEFVETLLKAFVDGASFQNGSNVSDPILIANFLGIFKATKDLVSKIAQFNEETSPSYNERRKEKSDWNARYSLCALFYCGAGAVEDGAYFCSRRCKMLQL